MNDLDLLLTLLYTPLLGLSLYNLRLTHLVMERQTEALQRLSRLEAKVLNGR